jgi:hypothetical protein
MRVRVRATAQLVLPAAEVAPQKDYRVYVAWTVRAGPSRTQNQDFPYAVCENELGCRGIPSMSASSPIELAGEIVAAFVSSNPLPKGELPSLFMPFTWP